MKASTGLRNQMLDTGSFKSIMDGCTMVLYAGTEPASADDDVSGHTVIGTVYNGASPTTLTFEAAAVNGVISKTAAENWTSTIAASGTVSFFRLETASDDQTASTTFARIQGSVGLVGEDLNISTLAKTAGETQDIDFFNVGLPTL